MEKEVKYEKKAIGCILVLIYSSLIGFLAYKYLMDFILYINPKLQNTGPLIILIFVVFNVAFFLIIFPLRKISKIFSVKINEFNKNTGIVPILSSLIVCDPLTAKLIINFNVLSESNYTGGGFIGLCYILFVGLSSGLITLATFVE